MVPVKRQGDIYCAYNVAARGGLGKKYGSSNWIGYGGSATEKGFMCREWLNLSG